ncbi:MAG: DUF4293 family protein [Bacteroidetes bacterium]|nr:DUF4293 family protein [Bacteroidota bacterium]
MNVITNGTSNVLMRLWPVVVLNALTISFAVFTILQFKSRVKQIRFTHFLLILQLIQIVFIVFDVEKLSNVAGKGI